MVRLGIVFEEEEVDMKICCEAICFHGQNALVSFNKLYFIIFNKIYKH